VWNGYLGETSLEGIALLPLFLSCRAAVRAKTSATAARFQADPRRVSELQELARSYLAMAEQLLHPPSPVLCAVGGLSGSGKSVLAFSLAPSVGAVPGAVVIRSDEVRKRLLGVHPLERLGAEGYTPEVSARVYSAAFEQASQVLRSGHSVVVDAVFVRQEDRRAIEAVATRTSVPFTGVWLDAPDSTLMARTRLRQGDASDADEAVVRLQRTQDTGQIDWHRIDASSTPDAVLRSVTALPRLNRARPDHQDASRRQSGFPPG
jgi:predicted kinase